MTTVTLGENILKLRVASATFEVRRKLYENAKPIANKNGWKFCFTCQNDDTLARNRDTLMILFKGYLTMYHYGECSDYQNVVRKVRWNNDTMILFSKKKLFVRKSRRLFAEPSRIKLVIFLLLRQPVLVLLVILEVIIRKKVGLTGQLVDDLLLALACIWVEILLWLVCILRRGILRRELL